MWLSGVCAPAGAHTPLNINIKQNTIKKPKQRAKKTKKNGDPLKAAAEI
jgi:hypothetical protein